MNIPRAGTYYRAVFLLLAVLLFGGCAGGPKYERGDRSCERGQYWSQTAAACVPIPGP